MGLVDIGRRKLGQQLVAAAITIVVFVSCGMPPKRVYQANPPDPSLGTLPLKIAVVELEDGSPPGGFRHPHLFNNSMIPGALYGTEMRVFHNTLFGKCVATELNDSQIFGSVEYHRNWEKLEGEFRTYDLIVTGRLLEDKTEVKNFFYGLSMPGDILWILGLPAESASREVRFEVKAFRPLQPEQLIWTHQITFDDSTIAGMYYRDNWGDISSIAMGVRGGRKATHTDFCTTDLLQPRFLAMRKSLVSTLNAEPLTSDGQRNSQATQSERKRL